MTISDVSEKYGLSPDTLRYYERIGVIPPVPRNKNGIRNYGEESCAWIELVKCMRNAGVKIEALKEYVSLVDGGDETLEARQNILIEQRTQLEDKINELQETLARLNGKIEHYDQYIVDRDKKL